jgi:uncharacterized damage-inducible protein DinB
MRGMNPRRTYGYLARARDIVFDWVRPLSPDDYQRRFPIGPGSLAKTLAHILMCEWIYVRRMQRLEIPPFETWEIRDDQPPTFDQLEHAWRRQADQTRAAIDRIADWEATIEYRPALGGITDTFITTPGMLFTQLALHEMHHRAQVLNMLRHLGVALRDIDFNDLMETRKPPESIG